MIRVLMSGIGPVDLDPVSLILTPVDLQVAVRLWWLVQHNPRKAVQRMEECEKVASEYVDADDIGWLWDLPVPPNYQLCPCCSC